MEHFTVCSHCRNKHLHYTFCQDLGTKNIFDIPWPSEGHISFSLFRIKQHIGGSGRDIPNTEIFIPGFYEVWKLDRNSWENPIEKEYQTFIAPSDYAKRDNQGRQDLFYVREDTLKIPIPEEVWKPHPHALAHSTFQFYFLNNSLFTANLPHLRINSEHQIQVDWKVRTSPSGTYVFFRSGHIFFKWKIEVQQGIVNMSLAKVATDAAKSLMRNTFQTIGSANGIDVSGFDKFGDDMIENAIGKDRGKDFMKREKDTRNQELQTQRLFQSTSHFTSETMLEPSIFYANTVKFPYNLFDYWLRNEENPFTCRVYSSNNLLNNLKHNNNENPITYPLNITFEKLGNILKPGFYQSRELCLDYDPNNNMATCFARGITFYEDKKKHFVNPDLGFRGIISQVQYSATGGNSYIGQAIQESEEYTNTIDRTKGSNFHQRAHFFITYEDGTQDHWLVLFPQSFQDSDLHEGHSHGGFDLKFDKPVKEFIDVYACIGCGAKDQGYTSLHPGYDDGSSDSLDRVNKGLSYEPWFSEFTNARLQVNKWMCPGGKCLGSTGDVWEFTGQYIRGKDNKPFTEAYGFIPQGGTIRWTTKGGSARIEWQSVPGRSDFSQLDWNPPTGSGGELEIPLTDPEISVPEPGEGDIVPDLDLPTPDLFDPHGGEVEIPPIEIDTTIEVDTPEDDLIQDFDPPPVEVEPPEPDPNDQDTGQDPETGEIDPPEIDVFNSDDND